MGSTCDNSAFYGNSSDTDMDHGGTGLFTGYRGLMWDLARGNNVYKHNAEVRPKSKKVLYLIKF